MKEELAYHIDVTPEEDSLFRENSSQQSMNKKRSIFWKIFVVVLSAHALVGGALALSARPLIKEPPETKQQTVASPSTPTPLPTPETTPTPEITKPTTAEVIRELSSKQSNTTSNQLTKNYIVRKGDTLHSISKKYKLDINKLIKLNNIKDVNKIYVGQKLKFM